MTPIRWWKVLSALVLCLAVNAALAEDKTEGRGKPGKRPYGCSGYSACEGAADLRQCQESCSSEAEEPACTQGCATHTGGCSKCQGCSPCCPPGTVNCPECQTSSPCCSKGSGCCTKCQAAAPCCATCCTKCRASTPCCSGCCFSIYNWHGFGSAVPKVYIRTRDARTGAEYVYVHDAPSGNMVFGVGVNSDAGLTGGIVLNERNFDIQQPVASAPRKEYVLGPTPIAVATPCPMAPPPAPVFTPYSYAVTASPMPCPPPCVAPMMAPPAPPCYAAPAMPPCCYPACPMTGTMPGPYSAGAALGHQYAVNMMLAKNGPGESKKVLAYPKLAVLEGQTGSITLGCGVPQSFAWPVSSASISDEAADPAKLNCQMEVQVTRLKSDKVLVELAVEQNEHAYCGKHGSLEVCTCMAASQEVKLGKTVKLVMKKDAKGAPQSWVELEVNEVPEPAKPSKPAKPAVAGLTLPSGHYLQHPPQYMPPAPAFPLVREYVQMEQISPVDRPSSPRPYASCPAPVVQCATTTTVPVAHGPSFAVSVSQAEGNPFLDMQWGDTHLTCRQMTLEMPGCGKMELSIYNKNRVLLRGPKFNACADRLSKLAAGDRLVFQGHVKLNCSGNKEFAAEVAGDRVMLELKDGKVEIKTVDGSAD